MTNSNGPRQWWLSLDESNKEPWPAYETNRPPSIGNRHKFIHVIEYSAYQNLETELKRLITLASKYRQALEYYAAREDIGDVARKALE